MNLFRQARIFLLLFLLCLVAVGTWLSHARLTDWDETVWVAVRPIAGDDRVRTRAYLSALSEGKLRAIERFFERESRRYRLPLRKPVKLLLGPVIHELPPQPPENGSVLSVMLWSLRFRYWAWRQEDKAIPASISLFVIYHDPDISPAVPHSLGLKEGHIGMVHAFAEAAMTQSNNVVIAHELLHTFGASDKYDLVSGMPVHPAGFADPDRVPLYPQERAEIMAGRIPQSRDRAATPDSLKQVVMNESTAGEIGWRAAQP